jgi:hypothetical protein
MIAVVVFIKPVGVLTQTVFAVLILFLSYTLQIIYGPYLDQLMDRIEVASLLVNLLTLVPRLRPPARPPTRPPTRPTTHPIILFSNFLVHL